VHFTPKDWIFAFFIFWWWQANIGRTLSVSSLTPPKNLSAVSLTPLNSFSVVSLTPAINFRPFGYFWPINFSPVSLTPLNSFSPVLFTLAININSRLSPRIFEKIQNGPNGILMGLGDTDSWKKPELENLVSWAQTMAQQNSTTDLET
jgi:hypothetical protein